MNRSLKLCCAFALTSMILAGCGAPKPPLPSGERIPVNSSAETEPRQRLADEQPSLDPFEEITVSPVLPQGDKTNTPPDTNAAPVVLEAEPQSQQENKE